MRFSQVTLREICSIWTTIKCHVILTPVLLDHSRHHLLVEDSQEADAKVGLVIQQIYWGNYL